MNTPEDADEEVAASAEDDKPKGSRHSGTRTTETILCICDHDFEYVYVLCFYFRRCTYVCIYATLSSGMHIMLSMLDLYPVSMCIS